MQSDTWLNIEVPDPVTFLKQVQVSRISCGLVLGRCEFSTDTFADSDYSRLQIARPKELECAVVKRKAEYLAGRYLVKCLLLESGFEEAPDIGIGSNRQPLWPSWMHGSISHSSKYALCVLRFQRQPHYLGIDIERFMDSKLAVKVGEQIFSQREKECIRMLEFTETFATTLAFSAKESLFKALYPDVNTYFGFDAAYVANIDYRKCILWLRLDAEFAERFRLPRDYKTHYFINDDCVVTLVASSS